MAQNDDADTGTTPVLSSAQQAAADEKAKAEALKAVADARKAQADAEKAAYDAELAAETAKLGGVPDSKIAGDVSAGTSAGKFEAQLLAIKAIRSGAKGIATDISTQLVDKNVYVYPEDKLPDLRKVSVIYAQKNLLQKAASQVKADVEKFVNPPEETGLESVAGVGLTLDSISKILGFFRSDFQIENIDVTAESILLVQALVGDLRANDAEKRPAHIYVPSLYDAQLLGESESSGIGILTDLFAGRNGGSDAVDKLTKEIATREKAIQAMPDAAGRKKAEEGLLQAKDLLARAQTVVQAYDALRQRLQGTDDAAATLLGDLIAWQKLKDSNGVLLVVSVRKAGGASYTQKNLWTFFGKVPFSVAGGAVLSYTLFDGADGSVMASALIPLHGGYQRIQNVAASLPVDSN